MHLSIPSDLEIQSSAIKEVTATEDCRLWKHMEEML